MATNPYTSVSVTGYNANPPSDDGTEATQNEVAWSKPKEKLGDPLKTAIEAIDTNVATAFAATVNPPGKISFYAGSGDPTAAGSTAVTSPPAATATWLICDGRTGLNSVTDTTLADLFAVIGVTFGGAGAADFDLPDLRGYFIRGHDDGAGNDPDAAGRTGGDAVGSTQAHAIEDHGHNVSGADQAGTSSNAIDIGTFQQIPIGIGTITIGATSVNNATKSTESRPLNIAFKYIIKK